MLSSLLLVCLLLRSYVGAQEERNSLILYDNLGPYYPYVVHLPGGSNPPALPPLLLGLHGTGSVGTAEEAFIKPLWNGVGRRIRDYINGNMSSGAITAGEDFITVLPIAPNETLKEWRIEYILPILDEVAQNYAYDPNRVYWTGYSMGARAGWRMMMNSTYNDRFAAAALAAGDEDPITESSLFTPLRNIPMRHYASTGDFDSSLTAAHARQDLVEQAGSTVCELVILTNVSHNDMAEYPFNDDMLTWLLQQNRLNQTSISSSAVESVSATDSVSITESISTTPTSEGGSFSPGAGVYQVPMAHPLLFFASLLFLGTSLFL